MGFSFSWNIGIDTIISSASFVGAIIFVVIKMRVDVGGLKEAVTDIKMSMKSLSQSLIEIARQDERIKAIEQRQNERISTEQQRRTARGHSAAL